jgi:hypothetical protein
VPGPALDPEALFVALALVPTSFSRNKFFSLYSDVALFQARRRAHLVRELVRELGVTSSSSGVQVLEEVDSPDGLKLVYQITDFDYRRTAMLSKIEAAVLRYGLSRAGVRPPSADAERFVREALSRFENTLELRPERE